MKQSKIAYISFDTVPAPKGAAIHITAFAQAVGTAFDGIDLVTVSPTRECIDSQEIYPQVAHTALAACGDNLIQRILNFRHLLKLWLQDKQFQVIHIRSIYEGFVIAQNKQKYCQKLIFEVNGLPSIELKYRYPNVVDDQELLHKLYTQEQICLAVADLIITPSSITSEYLQSRGISDNKIRVIPNGVDLDVFTYSGKNQNLNNQSINLIYFGTLSPWQGVNLAIEALALINREIPADLTVIGQARYDQIKTLKQLAVKLEVAEQFKILEPISQQELVQYIHHADVILAPLTPNDRNLIQGCCPLKILEGMATGTPVIASDLPVVRELGEDGVHFLLVKPSSAKAIKDAVLRLQNEPELATYLAANARGRIEQHYTWQLAGEALIAAYTELGVEEGEKGDKVDKGDKGDRVVC
ncbi:glycosyltransferase family 4 protein [Nostoc sp. FACHB-190]|uniref:glycosyltransferase family 4 protein n=1 Tax=Nostoc sp. FACHB-190 TaxID=2692838 RepID=UPI0016878162|nr:glycosyltransferase family 4 protein [Nostoc sp. FACHB-190]MBD2301310.1 glycosyltransferase family 4 protein [Nostoc sp. FACHB-190]